MTILHLADYEHGGSEHMFSFVSSKYLGNEFLDRGGVLFLTAHKTSPVSKAVVPIYISLSMRAPLFQIHPYMIPLVISLSKQSQYVVLIYLCVRMQAQACPSTHVRGHLAGAGSPPCSPGIEFSFIRLGGKLF